MRRTRIKGSKWFKLLQLRAKAIAKRTGRKYPAATVDEMRDIHAEAEGELGPSLKRAFVKR